MYVYMSSNKTHSNLKTLATLYPIPEISARRSLATFKLFYKDAKVKFCVA